MGSEKLTDALIDEMTREEVDEELRAAGVTDADLKAMAATGRAMVAVCIENRQRGKRIASLERELAELREAFLRVGMAHDDFSCDVVTREVYIAQRAGLSSVWPVADNEPFVAKVRAYNDEPVDLPAASEPAKEPSDG